MKKRNAIALVTALFLTVFLLVLGLAFQTVLTNDLHETSHQLASMEAFYLAHGGMEYYSKDGMPPGPLEIPLGDSRHLCTITQDPATNDLIFTGTVFGPMNQVLSQRILVARGGNLNGWYEK